MKNWYLYIALFLFTACSSSKDMIEEMDELPNNPVNMMEEEETTTNFVSDAHSTSGTASVSEDGTTLFLTNFKSDDGPLLEVYLAVNLTAATYVSLGDLKGLDGNYQ